MLDTMRQLVEHTLVIDHLKIAYVCVDFEQSTLELRRQGGASCGVGQSDVLQAQRLRFAVLEDAQCLCHHVLGGEEKKRDRVIQSGISWVIGLWRTKEKQLTERN